MTTVKLFSQNRRTVGTKAILPIVGEVEFSKTDNSVEIDSNLAKELLKFDFGTVLLTAEQVEAKKVEAENALKKSKEAQGKVVDPIKQFLSSPLVDILGIISAGSLTSAERAVIETAIASLESLGEPAPQKSSKEVEEKLKSLGMDELKTLLSDYPAEEIKKLKSKEKIVEYILSKMN